MLRCKMPQVGMKAFWIYLLACNLIRLLMAEAALRAAVMPRQSSFKHTLQIGVAWSGRQVKTHPRNLFSLRKGNKSAGSSQKLSSAGHLEQQHAKWRPRHDSNV